MWSPETLVDASFWNRVWDWILKIFECRDINANRRWYVSELAKDPTSGRKIEINCARKVEHR